MQVREAYLLMQALHARETRTINAMHKMGVPSHFIMEKERALGAISFSVNMLAARMREERK